MEFEDKQTSRPVEPAQDAGSNTRFLQSMGFGKEDLHGLEANTEKGPEDEVALSSLPDDLEVPGSKAKSSIGPRIVGVQVGSTSHPVEEDGRINLSASRNHHENEQNDAAEDMMIEESTSEMDDANLLRLHCPSCDEELVLREEHVGVEGACVWCDTKIVAARSGMEGDVRIFALEAPKASVPEVKAPAEANPDEEVATERMDLEYVGFEISEESAAENEKESVTSEPAETLEKEPSSSWNLPADDIAPAHSERTEPMQTEDSPPAFSGWSGMAPLESESKENGDSEVDVSSGFNEASPENDDATPQPLAEEMFAGLAADPSPWGESLDSVDLSEGEKPLPGDDVAPDSPDSSQQGAETVGFGDLDFAPALEENAPALEESAPALEESAPAWEESAPALEESAPAWEESAPALEESAPAWEESAPALEESEPAENAVMSEGFAPSPFSGDTPPTKELGFLSEKTESVDETFGEAPSVEENDNKDALDVLFGASPDEASVSQDAEETDASPTVIGGFESPTPSPEKAAPSAWEGSIGSGESPSIELGPLPVPEEPFASANPAPAPEASGNDGSETEKGMFEAPSGFSMAAPGELPDAAPEPGPASTPASGLEAGFASPAPLGDSEPSPNGFQIPTSEPHDFALDHSTGQAPEPAPFHAPAVDDSTDAMPLADDPGMPTETGDSAPESPFFSDKTEEPTEAGDFSESASAESLFSESPPESSSLFSEPPASGSIPSPFEEAVSECPVAEAEGSPFGEMTSEKPVTPPALPASEMEAAPAVFGEEAPPSETSAPEKKKGPKTKGPRKGLVVMLVVLIGFVCGAALASFVLPVDQYVLKARNYMEQKFNPGGAVLNQDLLPARDPSSVSAGDSQP